jgi:hypothetical protein
MADDVAMRARERLPNRRLGETFELELAGLPSSTARA